MGQSARDFFFSIPLLPDSIREHSFNLGIGNDLDPLALEPVNQDRGPVKRHTVKKRHLMLPSLWTAESSRIAGRQELHDLAKRGGLIRASA